MNKFFTYIIAVCGMGILFAGCRSADRSEFISEKWGDTSGTSVTTDHVNKTFLTEIGSTRVYDRIIISDITMDEVNGLKRVNYTLTSTRHSRLRMDCRISWYNESGMEIDPDANTYRHVILEGNDTKVVSSVANSPDAVTSRLRVRETRYSY